MFARAQAKTGASEGFSATTLHLSWLHGGSSPGAPHRLGEADLAPSSGVHCSLMALSCRQRGALASLGGGRVEFMLCSATARSRRRGRLTSALLRGSHPCPCTPGLLPAVSLRVVLLLSQRLCWGWGADPAETILFPGWFPGMSQQQRSQARSAAAVLLPSLHGPGPTAGMGRSGSQELTCSRSPMNFGQRHSDWRTLQADVSPQVLGPCGISVQT